ncbi:MAG: protein-export chaperone SecB [Hyphomicrobiales bacterium]
MTDENAPKNTDVPRTNGQSLSDSPASTLSKRAGQPPGEATPSLQIIGQYLKDLSFENPKAPLSLSQNGKQPQVEISVNVSARIMGACDYEVNLQLSAKANRDDDTVFGVELVYAGLFRLRNTPQETVNPLLLIECPHMLFPFARQIMADATRNGGFPPLLMDPVDFSKLYRESTSSNQASHDSQ